MPQLTKNQKIVDFFSHNFHFLRDKLFLENLTISFKKMGKNNFWGKSAQKTPKSRQ